MTLPELIKLPNTKLKIKKGRYNIRAKSYIKSVINNPQDITGTVRNMSSMRNTKL